MELLAPAGDRASMVAAVQQGADAVYLGYTAFSARGNARNFDENGLRNAVAYCHERGCRVYVTVNTLVKEREMAALRSMLALVRETGADAVIVQDMGVAAVARACFPDLPLHASTQMALHNAQGAAFARKQGFVRIVAARECPVAELSAMAREGVEVEAFAHGALCVSLSGQCLFSSMVGGRSGNRGRCAQPCRLPYRTRGGASAYLLSMRDLMTLERLPELAEAGVTALKIEGRMRRPEYVAVVTAAYRRALDALQNGVAYALGEAERDALMQVFHRGGFTRGHALGARQGELIDASRPGHGGLEMGVVIGVRNGLAELHVLRPLHDGDGLQVRSKNPVFEKEFVYAGPEVEAGARALLRVPFSVVAGDAVHRLTDAAQTRAARQACEEERRRVPVDATLTAFPGAPATLELTDGTNAVTVATGEPAAPAEKRALDVEVARKQIERMGGTPYVLRSLALRGKGAFLRASALNALRRDALEALGFARKTRATVAPVATLVTPAPSLMRNGTGSSGTVRLIAQTCRLADAKGLLAAGADTIYWSPVDYRIQALQREIADNPTPKVWFVAPPLAWNAELEELAAWVRQRGDRFCGVALTNPGHLATDWGALPRVADAPLHAWNGPARQTLAEWGCLRATLPPELNAEEIAEVLAAGGEWEMVVYERAQLMLLSHCPQRVQAGTRACPDCARQSPLPPLIDRKGYAFPLERLRLAHGCQVRLLNSLPTWLPDKHARALRSLADRGGLSWRLRFSAEPPETCETLIRRTKARLMDRIDAELDAVDEIPYTVTSGHFARGVE